jgi:hypothetical protein
MTIQDIIKTQLIEDFALEHDEILQDYYVNRVSITTEELDALVDKIYDFVKCEVQA